ncbi:MAG: NAD-dependent epimerase/dehydratase family protein [Hyphomicrobiaceae bacterium]
MPGHILVTGARGAIGRHVVRAARERGHVVSGLGHGAWSGDAELPAIDAWLNGEVSADNMSTLVRQLGVPGAIIHLAGGSHVGSSIAQPAEDFQRTVVAAQRVLEWIRTCAPGTKLVIASSAAVYGAGHDGPIGEDAPYAPVSPYGTHKAMIEMMAHGYARQFGLQVASLRIFSVYGPGLRKQLIWEVVNRLMRGEWQITLGGTGNEQRDFVEIADAAAMLLDAVALASPAAPAINCSSGEPTTVRELSAHLAAHFPGTSFTFSGKSRPGDPVSLVGNDSLARALGLSVAFPLEAGLVATVAWIKSTLSGRG